MKTRIILSGCNGAMGRVIADCIAPRSDCAIVAGIDINTARYADFEVYDRPNKLIADADVIIDFSHPTALAPLLDMAVDRKLPIVVCTTGLLQEHLDAMKNASAQIPVFHSGNMSLGINLMIALAKKAAAILGNDFDIEIIEKHHNRKLDAPSGTALMIANAVNETLDNRCRYEYDRHVRREKRPKNEIGIHAVRGGSIVGEHEVLFAGPDEIVSITHSARSRDVFATGAINSALFLCGKTPGIYDMTDLLS
ncbi:MAG: 4-hydroxy-tetrahydrodipicolinate reductase [Acetanaerobacterium sp.]